MTDKQPAKHFYYRQFGFLCMTTHYGTTVKTGFVSF